MPVTVTDQMGREVTFDFPPQRIVSLVPSQTELLADLGLGDRIAGITRFCIHPEKLRTEKCIVGGTKNAKIDVIRELRPDLVIGNKEENEKTMIEALEKEFPVWMSDIVQLSDSLEMIRSVGDITGTTPRAAELSAHIQQSFRQLPLPAQKTKALYLIWRKPWMAAGSNTFINDMLGYAGFENVLGEGTRYPSLSVTEMQELQPQYLLLSSEPYPFRRQHVEELQALFPETAILLVDGEMFSWYGSRLLHAPSYFAGLRK